jgi:hydroxymethylglutaryl-CoA reductase
MSSQPYQLSQFRSLSVPERRRVLAAFAAVDEADLADVLDRGGLDLETAETMVENAVGMFALPFGIALNVQVNGVDYLVPMAIEEPSVIAAASHAAKRVRAAGGFSASMDEALMAAQIEVHNVADPAAAEAQIRAATSELCALADRAIPGVVKRGGGAREIVVRDLGDSFVVVHVLVDCRDAMGANLLNTVAEALGSRVAELARGELGLRILSNYCDRRLARVTARIPVADFACSRVPGREAASGVVFASRFAERDPYRAVTHNKGVMNGIDAVVVATGNDFRAVEAAAHAYGNTLEGRLEVPLALGIVGGALRAHQGARFALALLRTRTATELALVAAAVGLATNLAALRALATEGIQRGHMALHHRATASNGATAETR